MCVRKKLNFNILPKKHPHTESTAPPHHLNVCLQMQAIKNGKVWSASENLYLQDLLRLSLGPNPHALQILPQPALDLPASARRVATLRNRRKVPGPQRELSTVLNLLAYGKGQCRSHDFTNSSSAGKKLKWDNGKWNPKPGLTNTNHFPPRDISRDSPARDGGAPLHSTRANLVRLRIQHEEPLSEFWILK